jgi:endo-1,4-beta-D-glucanase Y
MFLLVFIAFPFAAAKCPFPVNDRYPFGIIASNAVADSIQQKFIAWKAEFYEEQGDLARIKWDTPAMTVSEGIGYGMLIMVYMDNATNDTKDEFDKLWAYYKKWMNENGVMHWKINGFSSIAERNGASDAELDVALALLMAYKQWGTGSYREDAKTLINNIWDHEVSSTFYLKPGDAWNDRKNPSYFSMAAFGLFGEVDSHDWAKVMTKSYELMKAAADKTTGLVPDWCDESGNALGTHFSWDAVRTPWRLAWAWAWHGHADAKALSGAMAKWIIEKTGNDPSKIVQGYDLNGNENPSTFPYKVGFTGAFTCAGMVDSAYRQWVDSGYVLTNSQPAADNYYQRTLVVMYLLLLSGNMQNLWEYPGNTGCRHAVLPQTIGQPAGRVIYDIRGRRIKTLPQGASGVYLFALKSGSGTIYGKAVRW